VPPTRYGERVSDDSLPSPGELAGLKVAELKVLLKERALKVSGKKAELIDRLLGWGEEEPEIEEALILEEEEEDPSEIPDEVDEVEEPIELTEAETPESSSRLEELRDEVFEAEVVEAEIILEESEDLEEPGPEKIEEAVLLIEEDDDIFEAEILDAEFIDDEPEPAVVAPVIAKPSRLTGPSLIQTLTSPAVAAGALAILIMAAGGYWYWSSHLDPFVADPIEYGDEMKFTVSSGSFEIEGEEMVREFDRASGGALADVCEEFRVGFSGSGDVSVTRGSSGEVFSSADSDLAGVVQAQDAFGLTFLTVEQQLTHDLAATIESKTWLGDSSDGICSVPVGPIEGYSMSQSTSSWTELTSKALLRTESTVSLINQGDETTVNAVSFGVPDDAFSNLVPELMLPLKPVELTTVFGSALLEKGQSGESNGWRWVVADTVTIGGELGLRVNMQHIEIEDCIGWAHMVLEIVPSSPWPVKQQIDIQLEKSRYDSPNCGDFTEYLVDRAVPDGKISLTYTMTRTSSSVGSGIIDWTSGYAQRPSSSSGELTADQNWGSSGLHMPDRSDARGWPLEDAVTCILNSSLYAEEAAAALSSGGYVWKAQDDRILGNTQWNVSWVVDDDAGWVIVEQRTDNCTVIDDAIYEEADRPAHRRESIPTTASLADLEERLTDALRYPSFTAITTNGGNFTADTTYGYLLQVPPEATDLLDLLDDLQKGSVGVGGEREWTEGGKDHKMRYAMDGKNGRMLGWTVTSTNS